MGAVVVAQAVEELILSKRAGLNPPVGLGLAWSFQNCYLTVLSGHLAFSKRTINRMVYTLTSFKFLITIANRQIFQL